MRISAILGVKDEIELIEGAITHLTMIGVDLIIACDMFSTDGTAEVLEQYRSANFEILQLSNEMPSEDVDSCLLELIKQIDADWILFLDADEKCIPLGGDLKHCATKLADADVVMIDRFNIPLGPSGPWSPLDLAPSRFDDLMLIIDPDPQVHGINLRARLRDDPNLAWIKGVPVPKVMARPERIAQLTAGWHDIVGTEGPPLRRIGAQDLLIAHYPLTSWARFARKVDNIREIFSIHGKYIHQDDSWHWRRWLELSDRGALETEFQRNVINEEELMELRRRGMVQSAAEVFKARSVMI